MTDRSRAWFAQRAMQLVVAASALTWSLAVAPPASATLDRGSEYSHKTSDCRVADLADTSKLLLADPISVVLWGPAIDNSGAANLIVKRYAGWRQGVADKTQFFRDHGSCEPRNVQGSNQDSFCTCPRWHVRGRWQSHNEPNRSYWTVLTPHRDSWQPQFRDRRGRVRCRGVITAGGTHYVHKSTGRGSGFDRGREKLVGLLRGRVELYQSGHADWGNTVTMKQCNGQLAGSSGTVKYIRFADTP